MNEEFWQAIMVVGTLISGGYDAAPVEDENICVIERPIAIARAPGEDYEIWPFESQINGCPESKRMYAKCAGPTDESIREILIGGTGK